MSNHVTSLLRRKKLGVGFTAKSLMLLMGDLASDDGSGIWASKARMARELETTDRTVQRTIEGLIAAGFLVEVGRKKHRNGFTYEYAIRIKMVEKCEDTTPQPPTERHPSPQDVDDEAQDMTPDTVSPPTECHPTPDTVSPHGVTVCHPNPIGTQIEPPPQPPGGGRRRESRFGVSDEVKRLLEERL
ncbi:helix-turn-helix domain-containing protein [Salipiger thiooxidans]|uniref:helix-turn-helix domain-containing protein n=1 Tax=Salipiger thiooxidans TaxID=282683 RepID=UPI001CFA5AC4